MRRHRRWFRLTALVAAAVLALAQTWSQPLFAQEAPAEITPPTEVGRLAWTGGSVSLRPAGQQDWIAAVPNYPLTAGDSLWTQPGAEAGLQVADTLIALAPATELDLERLESGVLTVSEPQGEVFVRVGRLRAGESATLRTPRGSVSLDTPGRYAIAAGTTESPTLVTVFEGAARLEGPEALVLRSGQTAVITGDQSFTVRITPALHNAFIDRMLARTRPRRPPAVAPPPLVAAMPGGADLDEYGTWARNAEYGEIWYPRVAAGWVPYREGHWAYVAPWGWTWIDDAPWGFAPFHYGRWTQIGRRWAWVPIAVVVPAAPPYPVYAPALVTFFDVGAGFAAGVATGALLAGSVGWVPLGPFEAYHPYFRASPRYVREVNMRQVTRVTVNQVTINQIRIDRFRNRGAATVVPASALAASRPVRPLARPAPAAMLTQARPVVGRAPLPPTTATLGVTPAQARRQHIAPPPAGLAVPERRAAPGPARRVGSAGPAAGAARGLPPLAAPAGRRQDAIRPPAGAAGRPAAAPPAPVGATTPAGRCFAARRRTVAGAGASERTGGVARPAGARQAGGACTIGPACRVASPPAGCRGWGACPAPGARADAACRRTFPGADAARARAASAGHRVRAPGAAGAPDGAPGIRASGGRARGAGPTGHPGRPSAARTPPAICAGPPSSAGAPPGARAGPSARAGAPSGATAAGGPPGAPSARGASAAARASGAAAAAGRAQAAMTAPGVPIPSRAPAASNAAGPGVTSWVK